jgi:PKHD-type hydroxylase
MYKKIFNNPKERSSLIYPFCYRDDVFSDQELNAMNDYFSKRDVSAATIVGAGSPLNDNVRRSKVNFFYKDQITYPIFDKLNNVIEEMNDRFYNFDLNGYDSLQYTEYHGTENGMYNFHMDTIFATDDDNYTNFEVRKLSVVMCLNRPNIDFEGGQFQFNFGCEDNVVEVDMKPGRIIFFPSFLIHRVTPVTKGVRKSLVVWVTGPKFR